MLYQVDSRECWNENKVQFTHPRLLVPLKSRLCLRREPKPLWHIVHPQAWLVPHSKVDAGSKKGNPLAPRVHRGFHASWHCNGLNERVLAHVRSLVSSRKDGNLADLQVIVTGLRPSLHLASGLCRLAKRNVLNTGSSAAASALPHTVRLVDAHRSQSGRRTGDTGGARSAGGVSLPAPALLHLRRASHWEPCFCR